MNISSFFQFPGILITIGVVLLLLSIIIIIIAIKSDKKEDFKIKNNDLVEPETNTSQENIQEPNNNGDIPKVEMPQVDQNINNNQNPGMNPNPVENNSNDEDIELL